MVIGIMLAILALIGLAFWTGQHKADLVGEFTGSWSQSDTGGAARLVIAEEMKTLQYSPDDTVERPTGYFTVALTTDAGEVSGKAHVSGYPPWSHTLHVVLDGQEWTLHHDAATDTVSARAADGRAMMFSWD